MNKFRHLFEPIKIGNLEIKNRIVMPPVTDNFAVDGEVTDRMVNFYGERAKGGTGLITINTFFFPRYPYPTHQFVPRVSDDKFIPGLRRLTDTIHSYGSKCEIQLAADEHFIREEGGQIELIGPSDIKKRLAKKAPRPMTLEEIEQLVCDFVESTRRCIEGGFDIIQMHCSAGYLMSQFISSLTNKRSDKYGGNIQGRATLLLEIMSACQKALGRDIRISCRISGEDFIPGGNTLEDTKGLLLLLEKGGLKLVNVTTGWHETSIPLITSSVPPGKWIYLAETIKKVVKIPVISGTRINHPALADRIIGEGRADMVYLARPLIADPQWPDKAKDGFLDDIRPCSYCCLCFDKCLIPEPISCSVNPRAGHEGEYKITPARTTKKVVIIGAGPAGLEAANVAALRGHRVVIFDKNSRIGGQLIDAIKPPYKEDLALLIPYYEKQLRANRVEVRLGREANVKTVLDEKPDEVIVATGAEHVIPDIEGIHGDNVCTAIEVLNGTKEVREKVVVIGGGRVGCETAEVLLKRGKQVTILGRSHNIGWDLGPASKWVMIQRLRDSGAEMMTNNKFIKIDPQGVTVLQEGNRKFYPANSVVVAVGFNPVRELAEEIRKHFPKVYTIGDCHEPATVTEAVDSGFKLALDL